MELKIIELENGKAFTYLQFIASKYSVVKGDSNKPYIDANTGNTIKKVYEFKDNEKQNILKVLRYQQNINCIKNKTIQKIIEKVLKTQKQEKLTFALEQ